MDIKSLAQKRRFMSLDVIRFIAFAFIIYYHYFFNLEVTGLYQLTLPYFNDNMHIATLGVALFFMVSGFGLMLSAENRWNGALEFYKKRVTRIILPFYITWIGFFFYKFIMAKGWPFPANIPLTRIIFTVLGMDEYFLMLGVGTFSLGIGEWFLGCLMFMYLIFPFLRFAMKKNPHIFFATSTVIWLVLVFWNPFKVVPHMNFCYKLYEFIIGMYLTQIVQELDKRILIVTVPIIAVFLMFPEPFVIPSAMGITLFSVAVFLAFFGLEPYIAKVPKLDYFMKVFSKYSFEIYLVHHLVIYEVTPYFIGHEFNTKEAILLLVLEIIVMIWLAKIVVKSKERILACFSK